MRKILVTVAILVLACSGLYAQDEPIPPRRSKALKVGLFGGFTPGWLFLDVKAVNAFLTAGHGAAVSDGGVFMSGGTGSAYIMLLPNVRIGGMGLSGGLKSSSLDAAQTRRDAELHVGFGGVSIEYVVPIVERLDIAFGGILGWGGVDLTLRQSNGGTNTWSSEQNLFSAWGLSSPNNTTRKLAGSFFLWSPTVNVEYAVMSWMAIRVGASYVGMSAPSWNVDGEYDLLGVPGDVSGKGVMIQGGILIGTF
jgi:hypothetical protein